MMVPHQQRGAAILVAMVLVTMVATLAATAMAWQARSVDVQIAERARVQALWLLRGAMDWSRLLLRQDAQSSGGVDHLAEPWAVPLQETRLTAFISADNGVVQQADASADVSDAFLAGAMEDLQAKINLAQIPGDTSETGNAAQRLFTLLHLPPGDYGLLMQVLQRIAATDNAAERWIAPQRLEDLVWFGISAKTVEALRPYAYWGTNTTNKVNLNTASAIVLQAASADLRAEQAQALVQARKSRHFQSLKDAHNVLDNAVPLSADVFTVNSSYFAAQGWVRMDGIALSLQGQLVRNGTTVTATGVAFQSVPLSP